MISRLLILIIKAYKAMISPLLGPCCRFYPSCSEYSLEAISKYGAIKGVFLGVVRLCKCHPFHPGGIDLVP